MSTTRFPRRLIRLALLLWLTTAVTPLLAAGTVRVSAAASLTDVLQEVARSYGRKGGDTIAFNFAGSSTLALQIERGAPADLFISADEAKMNALARQGLIVAKSRKDILSNTLVVVIPRDSRLALTTPADLARAQVGRIAIAEPSSVPVGIYAKEWLQSVGVWDKLAGRIVPTENARATLAAVASGNVDAGVVYRTDALGAGAVRAAFEVPRASGPSIVYPAAVLSDARNPSGAQRFLDYLSSPEARAIFTRYGFERFPK